MASNNDIALVYYTTLRSIQTLFQVRDLRPDTDKSELNEDLLYSNNLKHRFFRLETCSYYIFTYFNQPISNGITVEQKNSHFKYNIYLFINIIVLSTYPRLIMMRLISWPFHKQHPPPLSPVGRARSCGTIQFKIDNRHWILVEQGTTSNVFLCAAFYKSQ